MNIQQQNGIISTVCFTPFLENDEYNELRKNLFDQASDASNISPTNRVDIFDETILAFSSIYQALGFLCQVFRTLNELEDEIDGKISLRSSLCFGDYFVHQDQIYGEAVNLATRLSCSSRENEMLVCGIDSQVIEEFIKTQNDIACFIRNQDEKCVSICLLDQDSTHINEDTRKFRFNFCKKTKAFKLARNTMVGIGRSSDSDIFIDSDLISRNHATITLNNDSIYIEDHSSNGTYVYIDEREIFLTKDSMKLSSSGQISCGFSLYANGSSSPDTISYMLEQEDYNNSLIKLASAW